MKKINTTAIIGAQWGDEGKGKLVDVLSRNADLVVRYSGGSNAGHTVVSGEEVFKLHLLPSGLIWGKRSLIGFGVVLDPEVLVDEITNAQKRGVEIKGKLGIDPRVQIVMPWHKMLDMAREEAKGKNKIGTTCRGIGPAYEDRAARIGIRLEDLFLKNKLESKLNFIYQSKKKILEKVYDIKFDFSLADLLKKCLAWGEYLSPFLTEVDLETNQAIIMGKNVVFEGAQGTFLDNDLGTYPYVTSSHPTVGGISIGAGVSPQVIKKVEAIVKAYTTRVGAGVFPSELKLQMEEGQKYDKEFLAHRENHFSDESWLGEKLRQKGHEFGTTTGRPRRTGWLDTVLIKTGAIWNGYTGLHITKLDVLGGLKELKICTQYQVGDKVFDYVPALQSEIEESQPVYETYAGFADLSSQEWKEVVEKGKVKGLKALPKEAYLYIKKIEEMVNIPILSVSVGPEREAIIFAK